jgi:hypothetical protein
MKAKKLNQGSYFSCLQPPSRHHQFFKLFSKDLGNEAFEYNFLKGATLFLKNPQNNKQWTQSTMNILKCVQCSPRLDSHSKEWRRKWRRKWWARQSPPSATSRITFSSHDDAPFGNRPQRGRCPLISSHMDVHSVQIYICPDVQTSRQGIGNCGNCGKFWQLPHFTGQLAQLCR